MSTTKRDIRTVYFVIIVTSMIVLCLWTITMTALSVVTDPPAEAVELEGAVVPTSEWEREHQVQQPSRDGERDPLEAAARFAKHLATYEPPQPPPTPTPSATLAASGSPTAEQWAVLRECESGGDYGINTGNGYSGAYQFLDSTWQAMGGTGSAYQASPAEQDMRALMLYNQEGPGPWPVCGQHLY